MPPNGFGCSFCDCFPRSSKLGNNASGAIEFCAERRSGSEGALYYALSDGSLEEAFDDAVGELIVWPGFIVGSPTVMKAVEAAEAMSGQGSVGMIFRISITKAAMVADVSEFAGQSGEPKSIIAAESPFRVDGISEVEVGNALLPEVHMISAGLWSDYDIDRVLR
jgi:hypothetical protein